jgi:hypothetical protein
MVNRSQYMPGPKGRLPSSNIGQPIFDGYALRGPGHLDGEGRSFLIFNAYICADHSKHGNFSLMCWESGHMVGKERSFGFVITKMCSKYIDRYTPQSILC